MKVLFILFFMGMFGTTLAQQTELPNLDTIGHHLSVVRRYLDSPDSDSSLRRVKSIAYLEKVIQIESETTGTYFGRLEATEADYKKWWQWYINEQKKRKKRN